MSDNEKYSNSSDLDPEDGNEDESASLHDLSDSYRKDSNVDLKSVDSQTHSSSESQGLNSGNPNGKRDEKWVRYSKLVVVIFLISATTLCSVVTYLITSSSQQKSFEKQFEDFASEIVEVSGINTENIFSTILNMGTTISSYAEASEESSWPFVTIPHFEQRGQQLLTLSGARYVALNVLVREDQKTGWEEYAIQRQGWVQDGLDHQGLGEIAAPITEYIYKRDAVFVVQDEGPADPYYGVTWQIAPAPQSPDLVNYNSLSGGFSEILDYFNQFHAEVLTRILEHSYDEFDQISRIQSFLVQPLYKELEGAVEQRTIVGYINALLPFDNYFRNIIPENTAPINLVLSNTCGQVVTYVIRGPVVILASGTGDVHDTQYNHMGVHAQFQRSEEVLDNDDLFEKDKYYCRYEIDIYPTQAFEDSITTGQPLMSTLGVVFIFALTSAVFILYDVLVSKRQQRVEASAARSNALVSSLFPAQVRDRLLEQNNNGASAKGRPNRHTNVTKSSNDSVEVKRKTSYEEDVTSKLLETKPIADLFPNATVLFADICGFTAWSSVREPTQVFTLLEQIYNSFDIIAKRRRIFKVETIGDCYVAAAGLPDPRPDHAAAMSRFASDCLTKMHSVVKKLEVRLGPDTGDLGMRFGLHSGPVTAGVLRGEKSRFQLFGDTVNTAARIESTGMRNRIHLSEATAELLVGSGKRSWVEKREGIVTAKGKGDMVTYWLTLTKRNGKYKDKKDETGEVAMSIIETMTAHSGNSDSMSTAAAGGRTYKHSGDTIATIDDKKQRLIDWNADVLLSFLKKIAAMRAEDEAREAAPVKLEAKSEGFTVLDEVREIIVLPQEECEYKIDPQTLELDPSIVSQVQDYVSLIASMYRFNSFHNFEHASHVTQSVTKLLSRIVTADDIDYNDLQYKKKDDISQLHKYTYGITSDPITQFACAFSALIHDVDHTGLPNAQLIKDKTNVAHIYKNKSVAEQNSVDLAWGLLMEKEFEGLRSLIYKTQDELERFRQLVVNSVMATDIADKELGALRKKRWQKAFHPEECSERYTIDHAPSVVEDSNRKATIVIEHLIQASDVSHTMQHWHVYIKWNEKLFNEMYKAFQEGKAEKDPSESWYQGELGFFDFYIIPLAKKLKECGVFGVASDEYLNYAEANRQEWESKGRDVVEKYLATYNKSYDV